MVSELPPAGGAATSSSDPDFAFAFNDSNFSDRTLRIEIIGALSGTISDGQGSFNLAESVRNRKRRRQDAKKDNGMPFSLSLHFLFFVVCLCLAAEKMMVKMYFFGLCVHCVLFSFEVLGENS